ncbi:AAA family ATPase [Candidatus Saccharibacteria bacterium]|nr:AAA family ATPase [Candidatus Saccharibacteria bacterium]
MVEFNYHSGRAKKARFEKSLAKVVWLCYAVVILLLLGGLTLVFLGFAVGWLLAGLFAPVYMLIYWQKKDLSRLPVVDGGSIDGLLSVGILGRLPKDPTSRGLVAIIVEELSGRFLLARSGLGVEFLNELIVSNDLSMPQVWEEAVGLQQELGSKDVSAVVLLLAMIKLAPNFEQKLAQYKLDFEDLKRGARWYIQAQAAAEKSEELMRTGGLARDWSFGFTPLLERFGRNISAEISAHGGRTMSLLLPSRQKIVQQMIDIFSRGGRQNATVVGPDGVGKTSVVHDFAEKILDGRADIPSHLKYRQVFLLNASVMISAASERGELEALMSGVLSEAARAKNVIICLDDAQLFFEDGTGSVDISKLLLPVLEAGGFRLIMTMNEQVLLRIGQQNPAVINAINRVNILPADFEETMAAMEDKVVQLEWDLGNFYQYQALKKAYELSERYVYGQEMPGRAIKMLESAGNYAENGLVSARSVEQAIESTVGAKVGVAEDAGEKEKLLNLEGLIHQRMVNQVRAVQVVSDALRRARAGVRNTKRPVGTFLFIGPTGVGKTELAKALAEVYYGGEGNIVRVDLNQFVTAESVNALTADGADNPDSLTAGVMKNPFSVVLLDEIEKAHSKVMTALLQVLDEGILRDVQGREVSFRDAILIATSNAGAQEIRAKIEAGEDITKVSEEIQNMLVNSGEFRPEFLNRFDEIVVFGPLSKTDLLQVVDLMMKGVNKTLEAQKMKVEVDTGAKELLVEAGYDPRLGARPMRRVIQRVVENEVAKQMLGGQVGAGGTIMITAEMVRANLGQE